MPLERFTYLKVYCPTTHTTHVFARGITAGDAVAIMNRKIKHQFNTRVLHMEAVQQFGFVDKPPIVFGPDCVLDDFNGFWQLRTFTERDDIILGGYLGDAPYPSSELDESSRPNKKMKLGINDSTEGRKNQVSEKHDGTCIQDSQAGGGNVESAAEDSQAEPSRRNEKMELRMNDLTEGRNDQVSEKHGGTCIQESQAAGGGTCPPLLRRAKLEEG